MTQEHPITPPPELVEQWLESTRSDDCIGAFPTDFEQRICTAAARWGADQELEACCEWLRRSLPGYDKHYADYLREARRPKPKSLKQQAIDELVAAYNADQMDDTTFETLGRIIKSLPD